VQAGWLKVMLPTRPNNSQGWIREQDATLSNVVDYVQIQLADRRLLWVHSGVVVLDTTVAIGAPASPTPTGSFFVTDLLPQDPTGPYGAWIVGLNAHSEAFSTFEGGDARIGIHGTNDPASIGQATSSGCVRVGASALETLAHSLPLGTPVDIRS
jgi:lipoprotein-anchoring transpeptidase ErfK/SrfK